MRILRSRGPMPRAGAARVQRPDTVVADELRYIETRDLRVVNFDPTGDLPRPLRDAVLPERACRAARALRLHA